MLELVPTTWEKLASPPDVWTTLRCTYPAELRFPTGQALSIAGSIAAALTDLHAALIAHGDIYAHNIFYHKDTGKRLAFEFLSPGLKREKADFSGPYVLQVEPCCQTSVQPGRTQHCRLPGILLLSALKCAPLEFFFR